MRQVIDGVPSKQDIQPADGETRPARDTERDMLALLRSFLAHRAYLEESVGEVTSALQRRVVVHDLSKLLDDEFEGFARINHAARENKFGTPEYQESMARAGDVINLHYSRNRHHPERPALMGEAAETARGLPDDATYWAARSEARMTFLDVIEMACDWRAAWKGYGDTRTWAESAELNLAAKAKHLSDHQLWLAREVVEFLGRAS